MQRVSCQINTMVVFTRISFEKIIVKPLLKRLADTRTIGIPFRRPLLAEVVNPIPRRRDSPQLTRNINWIEDKISPPKFTRQQNYFFGTKWSGCVFTFKNISSIPCFELRNLL